MSGINKVILIGRLGRDPETRNFQNGGKVCNLRLATSDTWKDKTTGERKERTEWHSIAIFAEPIANFADQYLRKGSMIYVEGQLETRKWQDQSGNDRYSTEVVLRPFTGKIEGLANFGNDQQGQDRGQGQGQGGGYGGGYDNGPMNGQGGGGNGSTGGPAGSGRSSVDDDEIPF